MSAATPGPWHIRKWTRAEPETIIFPAGDTWAIYQQGHDGKATSDTVLHAIANEIPDEATAKFMVSAIELTHELQALNEAWERQQYEIETLRFSLKVRTAQRDEAEFQLEHARAALTKAGVK